MKRSTKAALFSALLFPGLGHLYLRKYWVGLLLILVAAASLYTVVSTAVDIALSVIKDIETGVVVPELTAISDRIAQQSETEADSTTIGSIVFLVTWVIGIFDSYRLGSSEEQSRSSADMEKT